MFDLRRLVHIGRSSRQPTPGPGTLSPREPVKLVAITQNPDDAEMLRRIASDCGWRIAIVGSSSAAIASLNDQPTPLVICDRDISGESWHDVLEKIAALPQAVCVLLASRVDVVAKPFHHEELRRAVKFAWSWRGWSYRHQAEAWRKPTS
jgi:CheY-like chemotaxis protein